MKRVLVTGASGFVGRHLVKRLLREGCIVRGLVRQLGKTTGFRDGIDVSVGDICDPGSMKRAVAGCDTVFHLAAKVHENDRSLETEYETVNVEGTRNVLEAAIAAGVKRLVYFSSVKVFGESTDGCVDESCPLTPETAYGRSKLQAEILVRQCGVSAGLTTMSLRLPLVYGPGQKGNLIRMMIAIDRGLFPSLPTIHNRRSMLHIDNLIQAALLVGASQGSLQPAYIVSDAEPYSTTQLYESLCRGLGRSRPRWRLPLSLFTLLARIGDGLQRATGMSMPVNSRELEKLIGSAWYSPSLISKEVGYQPTRSFDESVPAMVAAYRQMDR